MSDLRTAAQQALEALESRGATREMHYHIITALRTALAQSEQEPAAWIQRDHLQKAQREPFLCRVEPKQRLPDFVPIFAHPPRREWRSLTEEEIVKFADEVSGEEHSVEDFARAIEAALKERNA